MKPVKLLERWLSDRLPADAAAWLASGIERLRAGATDRDLYLLISLVSKHVGRESLALTPTDLTSASASRPEWDPSQYTLDQAARIYLLLASTADGEQVNRRLDRLCSAADVSELIAFYRGLPLYPDQPRYTLRAAEGVRSNMRVVFEAVAHRNPYPAEQFKDDAWNQMVLKALFVGSTL
ncbi:MAG TPA: EboA domain-containing protein, partial [Burkholderiales bacterium]|nr:EboA domain-containing protein [Burkholderiales bacterium]